MTTNANATTTSEARRARRLLWNQARSQAASEGRLPSAVHAEMCKAGNVYRIAEIRTSFGSRWVVLDPDGDRYEGHLHERRDDAQEWADFLTSVTKCNR